VDDVNADPRRARDDTGLRSLICAPKLLNTLGAQTGTAIENARLFERTVEAARERERLLLLHEQAEVARAKLESEMELAARIQADLFPASLPPIAGYDVAAANRPAHRCGGDYYDALPVVGADGLEHVLFCVADVLGEGAAGIAADEQHAGNAARAARPHAVAAGPGHRGEHVIVRNDRRQPIRDRRAF